jgi:hypothetical protein
MRALPLLAGHPAPLAPEAPEGDGWDAPLEPVESAESEGPAAELREVELASPRPPPPPPPPPAALNDENPLVTPRRESMVTRATRVSSTAGLEPLNAPADFTALYLQEMLRGLSALPWRRFDTAFSTVGAHEQIIYKRSWMSGKDVVEHFVDHFPIGDWSAAAAQVEATPPEAGVPACPATPELNGYDSQL